MTSERVEVIADPEAPKTPGNYYVRACVDAVEDEVNTNNNCHVEEFLRVH